MNEHENAHDVMRRALTEAREAMRAADNHANAIAGILIDDGPSRLKSVSAYRLRKLKSALRDFDMTRGTWKEQP